MISVGIAVKLIRLIFDVKLGDSSYRIPFFFFATVFPVIFAVT